MKKKHNSEYVKEKLEKVFKVRENKAENLSIILSQGVRENNFHFLYEYLLSEIEFKTDFSDFCEKINMDANVVKKFLSSRKNIKLVYLNKILNKLGYKLNIELA